jgi:hypothetical protein
MNTHWKKLTNPDYLGSYDFAPGEERIVTVNKVVREMVTGSGGKKEECTVCYFEEKYKPMILNSTNCKSISKLADSPYIEEWQGRSFKIVVAKVAAFGEQVDALRIKAEKVIKAKPILIVGTPNFENCRKAYKADPTQLDKIKAKYEVSKEVEALLNA